MRSMRARSSSTVTSLPARRRTQRSSGAGATASCKRLLCVSYTSSSGHAASAGFAPFDPTPPLPTPLPLPSPPPRSLPPSQRICTRSNTKRVQSRATFLNSRPCTVNRPAASVAPPPDCIDTRTWLAAQPLPLMSSRLSVNACALASPDASDSHGQRKTNSNGRHTAPANVVRRKFSAPPRGDPATGGSLPRCSRKNIFPPRRAMAAIRRPGVQ